MKNILTTLMLVLIFAFGLALAQNITNTLGTGGLFTIKDGSTNYFTLSQSTGNVSLFRNMELGGITSSTSTIGVITKNGSRFIHNYQAPGTSGLNTFIGLDAGNFTMSGIGFNASFNTGVGCLSLFSLTEGYANSAFGFSSLYSNTAGSLNLAFGNHSLYSNTTGNENSAFGFSSLYSNTTGYSNSAFGKQSLYSNTEGYYNSAFGYWSLYSNTEGYVNSAFGYRSLYSNTTGDGNSAFGNASLYSNTTGDGNSAFGNGSLYNNTTGYGNSAFGIFSLNSNTTGFYNSAFGNGSLNSNTTGFYNSAFGFGSLYSNTTGNHNTAIGFHAGSNITTGTYNIAIGYDAQVPSGTASNQIRLGNTSIAYAGIQVAWTVTSDRRYKDNITPLGLGLGFISKLNPVSYQRKNDENKKTEYGLIAQEVEQVLKELGIENHAMLTITDEGMYELRYNDLIAPMIKAIQELKFQYEQLSEELHSEKIKNATLEERHAKYEEMQAMLVNEIERIKSNQENFTMQLVNSNNNNQ